MPPAAKHKPRPTAAVLAGRLRVGLRTFERWRSAGLPMPRPDEALGRWRPRAARWIARQAQARQAARGPQDGDTAAVDWLLRFRAARARRAAIALAKLRASLHSAADCAAQRGELRALVGSAFEPVAAQFEERLRGQTAHEPEVVQAVGDTAVRAAFDVLQAGWPEPAAQAPFDDAADIGEPPPDASASARSDWWLARWRRARAEREELQLAIERAKLHGKAECEAALVQRCSEFTTETLALPSRWARSFAGADVEQVAATDLARVLDGLERGFPEAPDVDLLGEDIDDEPEGDGEDDAEPPQLDLSRAALHSSRIDTAHPTC